MKVKSIPSLSSTRVARVLFDMTETYRIYGLPVTRGGAARLWRRLPPLATPKMPLDLPPPWDSRFGSPLTLSRVHRVRPELVAEVKYLTWTEDNLLRQLVYEGLREDKPPTDIRRPIPHPQPAR
jgi:ATP-dependent DNA ligase